MKTIQVTHPSGCSMEFSENLLTFLHVRKNSQRFNIGEWLSTLGENLLCQLAILAEVALNGEHKEISQDLLFCVRSGFEAEMNLRFHELDMEQCVQVVRDFCLMVILEKIQRRGRIEIINDLSLDPHASIEYMITEEGMRNKSEFSKILH